MPVPVSCVPKPPAHPVIKPLRPSDNGENNSFRNLTRTLPVSPTGPPPSFGTREQWINSLPSWRRSKPRQIWEEDPSSLRPSTHQVFHQGLAVADNATAIKGSRAQACVPPLSSSSPSYTSDVPMYQPRLLVHPYSFTDGSAMDMDVDSRIEEAGNATTTDIDYGNNTFTPFYEDEDDSPGAMHGNDLGSSPLEPITPLSTFVDQAMATVPFVQGIYHNEAPARSYPYNLLDEKCGGTQYFQNPHVMEVPQEPVPAPAAVPDVVTPTATAGYRKLSEPLSEWIATFVWKFCTTGSNIPSFIPRPVINTTKTYPALPPSYLATSVHSLLLSTLLQPSAIFLALWYIVRLPGSFGTANLAADHAKELRFRLTLLGDGHNDRDAMENGAPFRLIVLGCMLANKWLDDHTFSNKTWHTISNLPVQILNKLESLTLDIFSYDLSISSNDWSQWMSYVMSYHLSLSSPAHPQPISRPSSNPSLIIRMAIDEIIQAPKVNKFDPKNPQPVFIGLEERRKERMQKEQALELNLDEDGPLRQEYMPKRRISNAHSVRSGYENKPSSSSWDMAAVTGGKLPPPARWSPAADEPILRDSNRAYGRYVAVQPTPIHNYAAYPPIPSYQPPLHEGYQNPWPFNAYSAAEVQPMIGYSYEMPHLQHPPPPPAYNHHCGPLLVPAFAVPHSQSQQPHSRSQSLSSPHDQDVSQSRNHMRSFSQSSRNANAHGHDLRRPDGQQHIPANDYPNRDVHWGNNNGGGLYVYHPTVFAPPPPSYTWLRS